MRIIETSVRGSELWIRLSGRFGHGDDNLQSVRVIQSGLKDALEANTLTVSEVVIDDSDVTDPGGDGPLWSAMPAVMQRLPIRFVASGEAYDWLSQLVAVTNVGTLMRVELNHNL